MSASVDFSELTFGALLSTINLSSRSIFTLCDIATRHLAHADRVWSCVRKQMVSVADPEAAEMRALWYLIDALMKACPLVFTPLIGPKLGDYVTHQMPWRLVQDDPSAALWCDELIRTWGDVLSPALFTDVKRTAVRLRRGHELGAELSLQQVFARSRQGGGGGALANAFAGDSEVQILERPATRAQVGKLAGDWETFSDFIHATTMAPPLAVGVSSPAPAPMAAPLGAKQVQQKVAVEVTVVDEEEEYVPLPAPGAEGRALAPLDMSDVTVVRAPRKRPR